MRFHNDSIAMTYSFYDVITLNTSDDKLLNDLKRLRDRCLDPGLYHKHFSKWLKYFSLSQFFFVDGDKLRYDPYETLLKYSVFFPNII
jgi:heparan sulfate N-deacetylase/N-sulfotransferase NDST2